jgi:D-arabinose 1-dehydrogenase-like Zn-dependent alcohol dehydrogenase
LYYTLILVLVLVDVLNICYLTDSYYETYDKKNMRSIQVSKPNGRFDVVEREIPEPRAAQVRIKVQACGICHGDSITKLGLFPNIKYPRVPGHEIAGVIDEVGNDVADWKVGQRVGVGWVAGSCGYCESCRRGDFVTCRFTQAQYSTGISFDGGYSDYVITPTEALAIIPNELSATEAAPLMCAGVTTYNALRNSGARDGDLVAILGIGGLGHLGIQFAAKMGFNTVAIGRGKDKEELVMKLGARRYIDSRSENAVEELTKLGGAKVILGTVPSGKAMSGVLGGLAVNGKLIVIGASNEPLEVPPDFLLSGRRSIVGWPSGTSMDSQDTLSFSVLSGVRSMNEVFPLERAEEAYDRMMSGKVRFRAVLTTGN